ncbi:type II toxin-antitoxin system VapC family toxin [Demetria terragena]|uniref:type II toxin-antitoxin system VapC family toxin n=1 Tax=Demetria terragena TaxID=63959 RepID=UPI00037CA755|nr:type II toxin-antitoxin system VapC family toxin [Demetria terragena]
MIVYLDTSAIVPLLVAEPGSTACQRLWNDADIVASSRIAYVEAAAALAQAERLERLTPSEHDAARSLLDQVWDEVAVINVDAAVTRHAARIARTMALRGYDAVHCASAELLASDELVAATGDHRLLQAWRDLGLATYDTATLAGPSTRDK